MGRGSWFDRITRIAIGLVVAVAVWSMPADAQQTGGITGVVTSGATGQALGGVAVFLEGSSRRVLTNASGRFLVSSVSPGIHVVVAERIGLASVHQEVTVVSGATAQLDLTMDASPINISQVVVTASRTAQDRSQVPASVGVIDGSVLGATKPTHPSEVMGRVAGVYVNTTGGEGHMTAIRQPLTTSPVYLYLEDGVPTRSTGFFNHNALYEVNIPQASRIEVVKGPGNALYGSDAIGGVINVGTQAPTETRSGEFSAEGGENGYARFLGTVSGRVGENAFRADLNVTSTDGWRSGTAFDRQSGTVRWDRVFGNGTYLKTVATFSNIEQETAGTSALSRDDFENDPTANYTPISFREVQAFRLSTAIEKQVGAGVLSVTPFFRYNTMDLLPNWSLTFDPAIWETQNTSYGMQAKYEFDLPGRSGTVITGVDLDYSPGNRFEQSIVATREGPVFTSFVDGSALYDYDVTFKQFAPYVQTMWEATERLSISVGLRSDFLGYDYSNKLGALQSGPHRRPDDVSPTFSRVSPKVGATFNVNEAFGVFGAYNEAFRAPSEGQLFRQGGAENTIELNPVKAKSLEFGVRGVVANRFSYEVSAYRMKKEDDILNFDTPTGNRETLNAGETLHRGIELAIGTELFAGLELDVAYSIAKHTYEEWMPRPTLDLSGNQMEFAPNEVGNVVLGYALPWLTDANVSLEWSRIGSYFEDASNENEYEGHDLLHLKALLPLTRGISVFTRVHNLTDRRYAERASFNAFRGEELAPGLPRTFYTGFKITGGF